MGFRPIRRVPGGLAFGQAGLAPAPGGRRALRPILVRLAPAMIVNLEAAVNSAAGASPAKLQQSDRVWTQWLYLAARIVPWMQWSARRYPDGAVARNRGRPERL
jgi:hypothetical protein